MSYSTNALEAVKAVCDRLSERTATLFLGAGVNAGVTSNSGDEFPTGKELSRWICKDLLESPGLEINLDDAAEMARFKLGPHELNRYLFDKFSQFKPGTAQLSLVQLPWDVIYTTNYDQLVEKACEIMPEKAAGKLKAVFSLQKDITQFNEDDIIYYKLHGSIEVANTDEGRLILTKSDYKHYELHRKPLFTRLKRDLLRRSFVFIGYSFQDNDFRNIIEDCRGALDIASFPLSYAVKKGFSNVEETFWKEKYNIQLLDIDATEFLNLLKDEWISENRFVVPFDERWAREYSAFDKETRFRKVGESFFQISTADVTGISQPKLFFSGSEAKWADIRDKVPPYRDAYWALLDVMFPEMVDPSQPVSCYLITGAAGTGKTTLLYSLGYDLVKDFNIPVLIHIPSTPLDTRVLGALVDEKKSKRIVVFIKHASEYINQIDKFINDARLSKLPISVILEERKNQWKFVMPSKFKNIEITEFELGPLSRDEIDSILAALKKYNLLGKLTGMPVEFQISHFTDLAKKELIIALRELTSPDPFDTIIKDEFNRIPLDIAKKAYVYVAALGQIDLAIRYETLIRLLNIRYDQLSNEIFRPTEGVLISLESIGASRHNAGFRIAARHPIIASVIFAEAAPNDSTKFQVINNLLSCLDPGFHEDKILLNEIVRKRELVSTFSSSENRRAIYDRLELILPGNQYVLQHRSILERELDNAEAAVAYARRAVALDKNNAAIQNTLGLALEYSARFAKEDLLRRALLSEASKLFDAGISQNPEDPYGFLGKYFIMRNDIERELDQNRRNYLEAQALSFLEHAHEVTGESDIISVKLGSQWKRLGDKNNAISILTKALDASPTNSQIRDSLIRLKISENAFGDAYSIATEGIKYDPTSWRLHRHIARLMRILSYPVEGIKGNYEAAIRHKKGDLNLLIEYGAFLFMSSMLPEAKVAFAEAKTLSLPSATKNRAIEWWKDDKGKKIFSGRIKSIRGVSGWALAIPQNFEAFFWRNVSQISKLNEGDAIKFYVGFNAHGPYAHIIFH